MKALVLGGGGASPALPSSVPASHVLGQIGAALKRQAPLLLVAISVVLLPIAYVLFAYGSDSLSELDSTHLWHIAMQTGANLACAVIALHLRGRLTYRMSAAIVVVLCVHALVMLGILSFRLYYSRSIMLSAFLASIALVNCVTLIVEKTRRLRIGVVPQTSAGEILEWLGQRVEIIPSDAVAPSTYDVLLVDLSQEIDARWTRYISNAMLSGIEVRHLAEYVEELRGRASPDHFQVVHIAGNPRSRVYPYTKQALDVLVVLLLLPVAIPLALFAAATIAITMGRPILFVQDRVGLGGRRFQMYKFRTMQNVQKPATVTQATPLDDKRITPLGRCFRRFRIDEIPQLWNVLRGEMSIVGPRPEQPQLCEQYARVMATFPCRHVVRPGITGWAQVRYGYACDAQETREKLSYDLYYAKYMSLALDLKILMETVLILVHDRSVR